MTFRDVNNLPQSIQVTAPTGTVNLKGLEFEGAFLITTGLTLEATFSIADTEIRSTFCTDCQVTTGNSTPVGTQLPFYPKNSGTVAISYERPTFGEWVGSARADYIFTGKMFDSEANLAWTAPSSKVNLRFGLEKGDYRFELYGTNIFNDENATSLARTPQTLFTATGAAAGMSQGITVSLADKPTFGLRASVRF